MGGGCERGRVASACTPWRDTDADDRAVRIAWHAGAAAEWASGLDPRYKFDPATVDRVLAALVNAVFMPYSSGRHKQRWAEKTPKNIVYIETLFALFPSAQFIYVIRDPRDVYCSVREKAARTTPCWASITLAESARGWCRRICCGVSWRERPDRYREVRYEELVTQPEAVMRSVLTFLGEPWSPGVLEGKDIFSSSIGRWRVDLTAAEIGEIEAVAGEIMPELGYPLSTTVTLTA
jgi:hypothetical protein